MNAKYILPCLAHNRHSDNIFSYQSIDPDVLIPFLRIKIPIIYCCSPKPHQALCYTDKSLGPFDSVHMSSLDLPSHSGAYHNYFQACSLPTRTRCAFVPSVHLSVLRRK